MNDEAIQKIQQYLNDVLSEPNYGWSKEQFQERTYSRWATHEILLLILENPFKEADLLVWQFALQMECFLHITENTINKTIFRIAENMAEEILGLIL